MFIMSDEITLPAGYNMGIIPNEPVAGAESFGVLHRSAPALGDITP